MSPLPGSKINLLIAVINKCNRGGKDVDDRLRLLRMGGSAEVSVSPLEAHNITDGILGPGRV